VLHLFLAVSTEQGEAALLLTMVQVPVVSERMQASHEIAEFLQVLRVVGIGLGAEKRIRPMW